MKTLHLHRHASLPAPVVARPAIRRSTLRLGIALSLVGAVLTVAVETIVDVPVLLILGPVVIVGFALSWQASGRRRRRPGGERPSTG